LISKVQERPACQTRHSHLNIFDGFDHQYKWETLEVARISAEAMDMSAEVMDMSAEVMDMSAEVARMPAEAPSMPGA